MKNFQLRLPDWLDEIVEKIAGEQESTKARVIREAINLRIQTEHFARQGRRLVTEDPVTKEKVEIISLDLTRPR